MHSHEVKEKLEFPADTTKERVRIIHRSVRVHKDAKVKFSLQVGLDFSNCTPADMMKLATEAVWIKIQSKFRSANSQGFTLTPDTAKEWERTWNVKQEIIEAERQKATPISRAAAALAAMSADERKVFLEQMLASITEDTAEDTDGDTTDGTDNGAEEENGK